MKRLGYLSGAPRVSTYHGARTTGARTHVLGVTKAFERLGWEVKPFIVGDQAPEWVRTTGSEQGGLRNRYHRALLADLARPVLGLVHAFRACRELGGEVDLVYERYGAFESMGRIFKQHGVPWVLEVNGSISYELRKGGSGIALPRLVRWLERRAYRDCDVLVCVSESLKEIVVAESGVRPEKIVVLPNAVDTTFYDPECYDARRLFEGFTVGFLGDVDHWQGLNLLVDAVSELREEGKDVSLAIIGDGAARAGIEERAREKGVREHVGFVGRVPQREVPRYTAGFDVGFSGQLGWQGREMYRSPLKLYEYMAMGKPVIASAFEDTRRVIREGETGFLFRGGDAADLGRVLRRAYEARSSLPEMGLKAREEAVSEHDWTARIRRLVSILNERLGKTYD